MKIESASSLEKYITNYPSAISIIKAIKRWLIENEPDLYESANKIDEAMSDKVLKNIIIAKQTSIDSYVKVSV